MPPCSEYEEDSLLRKTPALTRKSRSGNDDDELDYLESGEMFLPLMAGMN